MSRAYGDFEKQIAAVYLYYLFLNFFIKLDKCNDNVQLIISRNQGFKCGFFFIFTDPSNVPLFYESGPQSALCLPFKSF